MREEKCVVLGVSGGIAAYKSLMIVSGLRKCGIRVRVVMTEHATKFVTPLSFEALSDNPVYVDGFARAPEMAHISLAKDADLFVIAPATANGIAKMAGGIADDLLSTTYLAMRAPTLIAPAMNAAMWRHPATQGNMKTLVDRGVSVIGPASGRLACGDDDIGRMSEPEEILAEIRRLLERRTDYAGKRVLVTAGPTREMIDPVRFLSNRSTGKMGYALAEAARARGAQVDLVTGPVCMDPPAGVDVTRILSTQELYEQVTALASKADIVIQAAAPADFRPAECAPRKIKKTGEGMALSLVATPDIASQLGKQKRPGQILVAFAAETDDVLAHAREKRLRKNADMIVANDVSQADAGFAVDTNRVILLTDKGDEPLALMSKRDVAEKILDAILAL